MARLLTVGHGTLDAAAFVSLLATAGVAQVVDVRRFPASRRHPHLARAPLTATLEDAGIGYRWEEALGGRRGVTADSPNTALRTRAFRGYADHMATPAFRAAMERLAAEAATPGTAALCAESLWWRCHRRLIADAAVLVHGLEVAHLMHDGSSRPHRLTDAARAAGGVVRYDGGESSLPGFA